MDALWLCNRLVKVIRKREDQIGQVLLNNELADMAQYRNLMGEIAALGIVSQEIKEILEKGTEDDDYGTILTGTFTEEKTEAEESKA
tara:strand:- start:355 stop:615 length:261 start_codon:yes stop_codon:yes gene_type:complete